MALALFPISILLAAAPAPAQPRPAVEGAANPTIVVTGRAQAEAALKACLERHCPPNEDIDASLGYAEQLFVAGTYHEARTVLLAALKRNRGKARDYPVPVSDLFRANALVANHLGLERDYYYSTLGTLESLRKGLPKEDYRHFGARLEVAAMMGRIGQRDSARRTYAELARDARKAGRPDVAAVAELRSAWMDYRYLPLPDFRRRIEAIANSTDPAGRWTAQTAKLYLAAIARREGRTAEADVLTRQASASGGKSPSLIYAPPYQLTAREVEYEPLQMDLLSAYKRHSGSFEKTWIDVGFWVQPDGRVGEVEILRSQSGTDWAKPLLRSISGRLYSRTDAATPFYRVERYTYTAGFDTATGSHIEQRSPRARVEYLDLTADPAVPQGG